MFEYNKFKHAAETNKVVIDNITTAENKRTILRSLQSNDRSYTKLQTSKYISDTDSPLELAWLGYFIGNNTRLEEFHFNNSPPIRCGAGLEVFRTGFNSNRSLRRLSLVINSSSRVSPVIVPPMALFSAVYRDGFLDGDGSLYLPDE